MKILKCDMCQKEYVVNDDVNFIYFGDSSFCEKCQREFEEDWDESTIREIKKRRGKDWIKSKLEIK